MTLAAATPKSGFDSVMALFWESADIFTAVIVACSVVAVAIIIRAAMQIRDRAILPPDSVRDLRARVSKRDWDGLRDLAARDASFPAIVVDAALRQGAAAGAPSDAPASAREAAELAASEQCAIWFRKIELLNVIGHLGPLLGLVGTVYGMIIAFAALGVTGGQAGPGELSLGIAKALFHTFLGLLLAIPSLMAYGYYRTVVDRICTRAMVIASELVEAMPPEAYTRVARAKD